MNIFRCYAILFMLTYVALTGDNAPNHIKNDKLPREATDKNKYSRHIYMKLPLYQPEYHWVFNSKKKFFAGKLTLIIETQEGKTEIPIFANGLLSRNWGKLCDGKCEKGEDFYFGFTSKKKYMVSETDKVQLKLEVKEDLQGTGAFMQGTLKAGTYTSKSRFRIFHLEQQTGKKDQYAFLGKDDWEVFWKLKKTSDEGWMTNKSSE